MSLFRVKAVYEYSSPHEDDLNFPAGQLISVTAEEGDDWYEGEYVDENGARKEGIFPRNFVEKYEPEPPPRPNRASRHKPMEQPAAQEAPPPPELPPQEIIQDDHEAEAPKPAPAPVAAAVPLPSAPKSELSPTSPTAGHSARFQEAPQEAPQETQQEAPKPAPAQPAAAPAKKGPPPVAAKSSSFRDRIAAFNQTAAPPVAPFKPGGGPPSSFIKKPFVAPPPSRNAYIPPPTREQPPVKVYRREEDPEIAERQAQDQENAERAGLSVEGGAAASNEEEEQPKHISLKERIALLQKQQAEQAERAAALHKEKAKKPPVKKRSEGHEGMAQEGDGAALEQVTSSESRPRGSMDHAHPPHPPPSTHDAPTPRASLDKHTREPLSDANDADQSGAGETEDAEGSSTSVEDDEERLRHQVPPPRASTAPAKEPDVGDEEGAGDEEEAEEDEEEDEMDAETRRKLELRERMAKMSGGMGMAGMFGGPAGLPIGGMPPKKKPAAKKSTGDSMEHAMPQRIPMFPGMAPVKSPEPVGEDRQLHVEKDDEDAPRASHGRTADEVPDVEDVTPHTIQRTPTGEHPPPVPTEKRPMPPRIPTSDRPVPPPVPSASRPVPPVRSPSPGSESGDELTDAPTLQIDTSPRTPAAQAPSKRSSYLASDEMSQDSPEKRMPTIPLGGLPTSPTSSRPPPPPPPSAAPSSRHHTIDHISRIEGESEYEGDYDTDIASAAPHKDALKSHVRQSSLNESTTADETPVHSPTSPGAPPPLPPIQRAVPPPPPPQAPPRASIDTPRAPPPPPPVPQHGHDMQEEDDDEYDPYNYASPPNAPPPAPRAVPPPPQNHPPPPTAAPAPPAIPKVSQYVAHDSSDEDDLYSAPPPRKSHDRPPPPPPQSPPHAPPPHHAPPPPLPREPSHTAREPTSRKSVDVPPPHQAPPPPLPREPSHTSRAPISRKSLDVSRLTQGRASMDQPRPSQGQDYIASDLDLGQSSHWWTQPNMHPPSLQGRKDVLIEMDESRSGDTVEKEISVLYMDYSQTIISARFDLSNVSDVELEQRHDPPPPRLRQDQLEAAHDHFGVRIAKDVESKQNTVIGDGTPHGLIHELLRPYKDVLRPVSTRAFGSLVYANLANASTQQYDEIRPGDIISFRNAKFQGKHGAMHAKYAVDVGKPDHVGVVQEWDGSKKKVRVWEQGRESKKVKPESFRMGDLRSGEVRVWRVMSRNWVGWS